MLWIFPRLLIDDIIYVELVMKHNRFITILDILICKRLSVEMMRNLAKKTKEAITDRTRGYRTSNFNAARHNHSRETNAIVAPAHLRSNTKSPWVAVQDPKGSPLSYYWNKDTNETTALGAPKPQFWAEVKDPNGSELTYWWNPDTDETTALGAPKPMSTAAMQQYQQQQLQIPYNNQYQQQFQSPPPQTFGSTIKTYFALGLGMSLAIAAVQALF